MKFVNACKFEDMKHHQTHFITKHIKRQGKRLAIDFAPGEGNRHFQELPETQKIQNGKTNVMNLMVNIKHVKMKLLNNLFEIFSYFSLAASKHYI